MDDALNSTPITHAMADLSLWGLFVNAEFVVKLVILILLAASFWSWSVIFSKFILLRRVKDQAEKFEEMFWSGDYASLDELFHRIENRAHDPLSILFCSGMQEWRRSLMKKRGPKVDDNRAFKAGIQQRVERVMQVTLSRQMERLEQGLSFMASVGSSATFVGLFGTVWGIMHSFKAIAAEKSTSLVVVAPAIAEALFATALGLIAAIPAMMAYNKLSNELTLFANRMDSFANEFGTIISHQLEETA